MMNLIKHVLPMAIFTVFLSCEKSDTKSEPEGYSQGVYIVNEGSFRSSNGSISYYDPSRNLIVNGIFEAANNRPLGDVVQSISVADDTAGYIAVNGSGKVEIVRLTDFKTIAPPIPVFYPRYFMQVSESKGYLTAGSMQGWIYIINLVQQDVTDSLQVGYGPETMVKLNDQVYVANSGGWGLDSTISVVNSVTDQVTKQIRVGKVPLDLALDADNDLWVYCKGSAQYSWDPPYNLISETDALLQKVDRETGNIIWQQAVGKAGDYTATPPKMAISSHGDRIFYLRPDGVYTLLTHDPVISAAPLIRGSYYGIEVNPEDDNIYLFESSFTGNGSLKIFNQRGNEFSQGTVGIAPNGAAFNTGDR
jgi:YVTN family beta-propeller protein